MCGIVGYIGTQNAVDVVIQGLRDLSNRGYQSAGFISLGEEEFLKKCVKRDGRLPADDLADYQVEMNIDASLCIGHTRWPTHGDNTITNAHPHVDCDSRVYVVHNGILTNFDSLEAGLRDRGHVLVSQTDTELVAHLVEEGLSSGMEFVDAIKAAVVQLEGSYAFLFVDRTQPDMMVAVSLGSPLLIGRGQHGHVVASDRKAIARLSRECVRLQPGDVVVVHADRSDVDDRIKLPVNVDPKEIDKQGHDHHMMKEIMQQADVVYAAMSNGSRLDSEHGVPRLGGFFGHEERLSRIKHVVFVACGTAHHAALIGAKWFCDIGGVPMINVFLASEAQLNHLDPERTALIAISQSGETKDTHDVVLEAKRRGIFTIGVVNMSGTSIPTDTDCGSYCKAGLEVAVASTKVFVAQLTVLYLMAVYFGRQRGLTTQLGKQYMTELSLVPLVLKEILTPAFLRSCKDAAQSHLAFRNFIAFIGRGLHWPIALEGALKLKEITYVPSEGYASGELKHGSIALMAKDRPVVALVPDDDSQDMSINAIKEVQASGSPLIVLCTNEASRRVKALIRSSEDKMLVVPSVGLYVQPIVSVVPMQLLAYYTALAMGREIDTPRNLAKTITVG